MFVIQYALTHFAIKAMFTRLFRPKTRYKLVLASLISFAVPASHAQPQATEFELTVTTAKPHWQLAQADKGISKSRAASAAQRQYGGKVLKVSRSGDRYRVKILQKTGKVVIVTVDARSGKVLGK